MGVRGRGRGASTAKAGDAGVHQDHTGVRRYGPRQKLPPFGAAGDAGRMGQYLQTGRARPGAPVKIKALRERILADTSFEPAGDLVPEIRLLLAKTPREILREASVDRVPRGEPPYWAFAWPGGQALARFVLDNADLVAGKSVL